MSEPYTNDFTYWQDHEVKFESQLGASGIYVTVYEKMGPEERKDFERHLRNERDVVKITFK